MALSDVTFTITDGNLGRFAPNEDNISGMILYVPSLPTGLESGTTNVFSLSDVKTLGLTSTSNPYEFYQIQEFYRINPGANLYILFATGTSYVNEVDALLTYSDGKVKQIGVFNKSVELSASTVATLNTACETAATNHTPIIIVAGFNLTGSTLSTLPDMAATDKKYVSVVISQDGDNDGNDIFIAGVKSNPSVGAALGNIAIAKVSNSIAWVGKYNISDGSELESPAFGKGELVKNQSSSLLAALENKGYLFGRKLIGKTGTYWNKDMNSAASTSDYNRINKVRTVNKAIRGIRQSLLGDLSSPVLIDAKSGKISSIFCLNLQSKASSALEVMLAQEELSGFDVYVDPSQNVLGTNKIVIVAKLVPYGTAEAIEVVLGFATQI